MSTQSKVFYLKTAFQADLLIFQNLTLSFAFQIFSLNEPT